jgi:O-antigen ligase
MKLIVVSGAYAIWLVLIVVVFWAVYSHNETALESAVLLGLVPAALQVFLLGFDSMGMVRPARMLGTFLVIVLLSDLFNNVDWTAVTYVIELIYISFITLLVVGCPDRRLLRSMAAIYSVICAVFLLYVDVTGEYVWGRLVAHDVESNFWALMGLTVAMTAFGNRSRLVTAACIAVGCLTIYVASGRGSMIGLFGASLVLLGCYVATLRSRKLVGVVGILAGCLVLALLFFHSLSEMLPTVADNLFKLNDPYRGVDTGFTGRDELWQAAFDLWWAHPLFGVGFRQHEAYLPLGFSAHNAYLAMLADTGIFGLLWYVMLIVVSVFAVFGVRDPRTRNLAIAVVVSYALIGLFERRAINGANPASLLFLMFAFFAIKEQAIERFRRRSMIGPQESRPLGARPGSAAASLGGGAVI